MKNCVHFGVCGGCTLQNYSYEKQLALKEISVQERFKAFAEVSPIIGCAIPWQYRNKMEFSFRESKKGERFLGLRVPKCRGHVVDLEECLIGPSWCMGVLETVRDWWAKTKVKAYFPPKDLGILRTLTLREGKRTGDRLVLLTVSGNPEYALREEHITLFHEMVCEQNQDDRFSLIIRTQIIAKKTPTRFEERLLEGPGVIREWMETSSGKKLYFTIRPDAFFQTNTLQAEILYRKALEIAEIEKQEIVYDLYCGIGAIGLFAAEKANKVIGIEESSSACAAALENISLNQTPNLQISQGDVGKVLENLSLNPDLVIVDPPRVGLLPKAMQEIKKLFPKNILYISCNPVSQVENIREFLGLDYQCVHIQPVDQFPHTSHIENIVFLKHK